MRCPFPTARPRYPVARTSTSTPRNKPGERITRYRQPSNSTCARRRPHPTTAAGTVGAVARIGRWIPALLLCVVAALCLAMASVFVQRSTPSACERTPDPSLGECYERTLPAGGWPFAFLYDNVGTSVLGKLGPEDDFRPWRFLADTTLFGALLAAGAVGARRLRSRGGRSPYFRADREADAARHGAPWSPTAHSAGPDGAYRHHDREVSGPGVSRCRTVARDTDGAAWSSQSSGVRPRLSRAKGSAPDSRSTSMVRRKPALAA
jgi:hypothetical protein